MTIFTTKAELECVRCHKVNGPNGELAGGEVGPELSGIGARQTRTYLLESIVDPNKQIAQGFEIDRAGHQRRQGAHRSPQRRGRQGGPAHHRRGKAAYRAQETIEERKRGPSAMPADLAESSPRPSSAT